MRGARPSRSRARPVRKSPARLFVKRLAIVMVLASLISAYLYVIGNLQLFLDSTQAMLLALARWVSLASTAVSLVGLAFLAISRWNEPVWRRLTGLGGYLLAAAFSAALSLAAFFIDSFIH